MTAAPSSRVEMWQVHSRLGYFTASVGGEMCTELNLGARRRNSWSPLTLGHLDAVAYPTAGDEDNQPSEIVTTILVVVLTWYSHVLADKLWECLAIAAFAINCGESWANYCHRMRHTKSSAIAERPARRSVSVENVVLLLYE